SRLTNTVYAATARADRVGDLLVLPANRPAHGSGRDVSRAKGVVELHQVEFHYPNPDHPLLCVDSAMVAPGLVLVVVVPRRVWTSTFAKLLVRLYDVTAGSIRIDGTDVRALSLPQLRRNVAMVLQETLVFRGTIAENIAYGSRDATTAE